MKKVMPTTYEVMSDLVAFASLVIKLGCESVLDNQAKFVEIASDVGFTTPKGCRITKMGFRQMVKRLTLEEKKMLIDEFLHAQREYDIRLSLFGL